MKTRSSFFINGLRYHHIYPAKCHLVQISQLIDCVYIGHVLHYYTALCCLLGLLPKFQYCQAVSYETW